ncbi:MAG: GerW family sporulation protein [Clostridia bacterium]|nr:GerW family sporulation protein [Clostridia bacterium]
MDNQINELISSAIERIKSIVDVNTVVGVPFETKGGILVFPLTKLSVGFVAGGGEYNSDEKLFKSTGKYPFAGGSGAGVTMHPVGLLTIKNDECKLIRIDEKSPYEKLIETIPDVISGVSKFFDKGDKSGEK